MSVKLWEEEIRRTRQEMESFCQGIKYFSSEQFNFSFCPASTQRGATNGPPAIGH